jgi:hypothetical protein
MLAEINFLAAEWAMAVSGLVYCASRVGEVTSNKGGHLGICLVAMLDQVTAPTGRPRPFFAIRPAGKPLAQAKRKHPVRIGHSVVKHLSKEDVTDM